MRRLAILAACVVMAGCATGPSTTFGVHELDERGNPIVSTYKATSKAGPFGTVDTSNQNFTAEFPTEGGGVIRIMSGQNAQGIDNSGQIVALGIAGQVTESAIGAAIKAIEARRAARPETVVPGREPEAPSNQASEIIALLPDGVSIQDVIRFLKLPQGQSIIRDLLNR